MSLSCHRHQTTAPLAGRTQQCDLASRKLGSLCLDRHCTETLRIRQQRKRQQQNKAAEEEAAAKQTSSRGSHAGRDRSRDSRGKDSSKINWERSRQQQNKLAADTQAGAEQRTAEARKRQQQKKRQ